MTVESYWLSAECGTKTADDEPRYIGWSLVKSASIPTQPTIGLQLGLAIWVAGS